MTKRIEQFTNFYTGEVSQQEVDVLDFIDIKHGINAAFDAEDWDEAQAYIDAMRAYYPAKQWDIDFAQASLEVRRANAEAQAKRIVVQDDGFDPYAEDEEDESWEQECELERDNEEDQEEYLCPTCGAQMGNDMDGVFTECPRCETPNPFLSVGKEDEGLTFEQKDALYNQLLNAVMRACQTRNHITAKAFLKEIEDRFPNDAGSAQLLYQTFFV